MLVTPFYTALFILVFVALSVRTLRLRGRLGINVGYGDSPLLMRAARAHSNFAEYVPLALLAIYLLETAVGSGFWIHAACITLLIGRMIHAFGLSQVNEDVRLRVTGMALTFTPLVSVTMGLLISYA